MIVVRASEAATLRHPGATLQILLDLPRAGSSQAMLGVVEVAPGARLPEGEGLSAHPCEELAYVLGGVMRLWVEGQEVTLGEGDAVFIRPGERHYVHNPGDEPVRAVFVLAPPIALGG